MFTTFLEIAANSLAAQTDPENAEKREQRYQEMASTMTPELLSSYARMLALLFLTVREYRDDPCDILGGIYHELNLNNEWNGQYFTPILIMYVFLQRYFIEGVERSGLAN